MFCFVVKDKGQRKCYCYSLLLIHIIGYIQTYRRLKCPHFPYSNKKLFYCSVLFSKVLITLNIIIIGGIAETKREIYFIY